jgi:hypothetical protein
MKLKIIIFCMFHTEIDIVLFLCKIHISRLYNFHICYMLKMYKRHTLKKPFFNLICIMQHFLHVFCIIWIHISCKNNMSPSINIICIKKIQSFHPTKLEMHGFSKLKFHQVFRFWKNGAHALKCDKFKNMLTPKI